MSGVVDVLAWDAAQGTLTTIQRAQTVPTISLAAITAPRSRSFPRQIPLRVEPSDIE